MNNFYFKGFLSSIIIGGVSLTLSAQEAQIGTTAYETLAEAIAAAAENETVTLLTDATVSTVIPVTKSLTLDLNGKTITNNVTKNRLFNLGNVTFTIDGNEGTINTDAASYGVVNLLDAASDAKLIINGGSYNGSTDDGAFFKVRTGGQTIVLNNVSADVTGANGGIVNSKGYSCNLTVNGGNYSYNSDSEHAINPVFNTPTAGTVATFDNVTVSSNTFVVECWKSEMTITDCDFTVANAPADHHGSCLAVSGGGTLTINGGDYNGETAAIYVYSTGGTINVNGGTFNGTKAAIKADNKGDDAIAPSVVNIADGTFIGALNADNRSEIKVNESSEMVQVVDATGKPSYVVLPENSDVVALVGITPYNSLTDAFAAAEDGETITLCKDVTATSAISVNKNVNFNLNGKTINNNVTANRLFRLSGVDFTIEGNDGKIITDASSYGVVDLLAEAKLIVNGGSYSGGTDDGSFFKVRTGGQSIVLNDVTADVTGANGGIVNSKGYSCNLTVNGGNYNYNSDSEHAINPVFNTPTAGTVATFDNVTVKSNTTVVECYNSEMTITDCDFTVANAPTNHHGSCLAVSGGGTLTINGGTYNGETSAIHVYNSGGTINVEGGTFNGTKAAIRVDDSVKETKSRVEVADGNFNGNVQVGNESELVLNGGNYTDSTAKQYCANGFTLSDEPNEDGSFAVIPDDNTTAIDEIIITPTATSGKIYNLQGICVGENTEDLTPGIYIVNGTKIAIR